MTTPSNKTSKLGRIFIIGTIILVALLELAVFYWSAYFAPSSELGFQLASRYSARVSFVIFSFVLLFTGILGLKKIYSRESYRKVFMTLIGAFAVNHLIHFYFLAMNHWVQGLDLFIVKNAFGTLAYLTLSLIPVYYWNRPNISSKEYRILQGYLVLIAGFFVGAYVKRLQEEIVFPSSDALLITHIVILAALLGLNIYRARQERKLNS